MIKINTVNLIYFSPTQTTRQVVEHIAQGIQGKRVNLFDLTPPETAARIWEELRADLAVIGMPVYGGRIPAVAVKRLRQPGFLCSPAFLAG